MDEFFKFQLTLPHIYVIISIKPLNIRKWTCTNCHETHDRDIWTCTNCHETHDRDINAAMNIKQKGLELIS